MHILWTGGWDSTYRVVELSREDVVIQPVYLFCDGRKSEQYERNAIEKISKLLLQRSETKAEILSVSYFDVNEIPENIEIQNAFNAVQAKTHLGSQHEWIARFAKHANIVLELGTEYATPKESHIIDALTRYTKVVESDDISRFKIDESRSSAEGVLLFENMRFPIIDKSELVMRDNIIAWGYADIMENIWFCHTPIKGRPCGICHPYEVKMESKMGFLLPGSAKRRYNIKKRIGRIFGSFGEKCFRKLQSMLHKV